ncbi:MAG: choloylglycine hydrolase [Clostridia bacterium]|nr:choloylglycine hydrolase [Clostridia bacterium]
MCTAVSYNNCFGRNLDLEHGYNERVIITPKNYEFKMRCTEDFAPRFAIIGMAAEVKGYPLYFDGMNEKGLCMAGLNFPNNAIYHPLDNSKINVTPFEFIPYILGKCQTVTEALERLFNINLVNISFSSELPLSPLHWIISDSKQSVTVESVKQGIRFYKNTVGVLTNNPPFLKQLEGLEGYEKLFKPQIPKNNGSDEYSLGLDGVGIPGDFSSASRFVRAAFIKHRSPKNLVPSEAVNQLFHILTSVAMPKGCVLTPNGECEYTRYTSCCDCKNRDYYFNTYDSGEKTRVSLKDYNLQGDKIYLCAGV